MKISIITPSYNQAIFIRQTIESVLYQQDYENIEYIVIDGCSNDGTLEILKGFKEKYPDKFTYIYEKDSGQANAINKGFRRATGDIIGWINSDDYYEKNILGFVADFFKNNPGVDMIYGRCNFVDENSKFIVTWEEEYGFKKCRVKNYENFNYDTLLNVYFGLIPQQTVFFRSAIFREIGYLDESYHFTMDYEYWLRIGKRFDIKRVDKLIANFRRQRFAKTNFKNIFNFIEESSRAHKKYGGKLISVFSFYNTFLAAKILAKSFLIKIGLIKEDLKKVY